MGAALNSFPTNGGLAPDGPDLSIRGETVPWGAHWPPSFPRGPTKLAAPAFPGPGIQEHEVAVDRSHVPLPSLEIGLDAQCELGTKSLGGDG